MAKLNTTLGQLLPPFPVIPGVRFADIPDFPGYAASSDGHVWSCKNNRRGYRDKWLQLREADVGRYWQVNVYRERKRYSRLVHLLVISTFTGPCPPGKQCAHDNGNSRDNRDENLLWKTPTANQQDRFRHGTALTGEKHPAAKLTAAKVRRIRSRLATGAKHRELASEFGVARSTITNINSHGWRRI